MTTKKQKREIAEKKRAAFEAQVRADGLEAQRRDRERNEIDKARWREAGRKENERLKAILAAEMIHEAQPFQERGPRYGNVTYDELAKFEGRTVPLKDRPGGEVIGSATTRMTKRGLEVDMNLEPSLMPKNIVDSFSDVGISLSPRYSLPPKVEDKGDVWLKAIKSEDLTITMPDVVSFSPGVRHVLDQPLINEGEPFGELAQILKTNFDDHILRLAEARDKDGEYLQVQSLSDWLDEEYKRDYGTDPDN